MGKAKASAPSKAPVAAPVATPAAAAPSKGDDTKKRANKSGDKDETKKVKKNYPNVKKVKGFDPRFPSTPKSFHIGGDIQHKRNLGRFVQWPRYVRLQRQKKILLQRLKVPPAINQFYSAKLEKNQSEELFKFLESYRPETKKQKNERLKAIATAKATAPADKPVSADSAKPKPALKMGLHHVTFLIEQKKAKIVVIAADTDPIELVVWMPALCRKFDIPYIIVRSKARLGALVHKKTASCLALAEVNAEDSGKFSKISELARALFNNNAEARRTWGGGKVGERTRIRIAKRDALIALEKAKKEKAQGL